MVVSIAKRLAAALSTDGERSPAPPGRIETTPEAPTPVESPGETPPGDPPDPPDPPVDAELNRLIEEHLPALRAWARRLCRGHDDADDVVHDAILRALQTRHSLRNRSCARSWLLSIVNHTFIDRLRRRNRSPITSDLQAPDRTAAEPPEPLPWEDISNDEVRAAVSSLPDDIRVTYTMFALQGRPYTEIAAKLNVSKGTVGTRVHRARRQLRQLLTLHVDKKKS